MKHTDNLSQTLQDPNISAAEGEETIKLCIKTLQSLGTNDCWKVFQEKTCKEAIQQKVEEPACT